MRDTLFTIGHSTHTEEFFLDLLSRHGITAVCDVRSRPYSRMNPHFNREAMERILAAHRIAYRFLGKELGGRSDDPACYDSGKVRYSRIAETELFKQGLQRVFNETQGDSRIALMCAEKEPLECHRAILVARHLTAIGLNIEHILADGQLENHAAALVRLRDMHNLPEEDLFRSPQDILEEAYSRQEERVAYDVSRAEAMAKSVAG